MWNYLAHTTKPIVLYGMGNGADKVLAQCEQRKIKVAGVFASDEFARHNTFRGYTVTTYAEAGAQFGDMLVLVCFGTSRPEVLARIELIAQERELLIPDLPVYGETLLTPQYYEEHRSEFAAVRSLLADEESKTVWDNLLAYRLTGALPYLSAAQSDAEDVWHSVLSPTNHEHFLDLGAYTGDTVREFIAHITDYAAITAIEADAKTYRKLCLNTDGLTNCRRIHAAVGNYNGTCLFSAKAGRGSAVAECGTEIPMLRIDSLQSDIPFTLINIDVEGNEKAAIEGMEETIRVYKPKMQIAAYHRGEDYISIPLQVLALNPNYRLYIRHFKGIPAWDTNFYFI